jgi:hypothetical protein
MDQPSRARRRFDTDRIVANRRAWSLREQDLSVYVGPLEHHNNTLSPIVDELLQYGRLADREPWKLRPPLLPPATSRS